MARRPVRFGLWCLAALGVVLIAAVVLVYGLEPGLRLGSRAKIGVVEVVGSVERPEPILDHLARLRHDPSVKAIIIRIDSPGGAVAPFQELYRELLLTRKVKKVVASLGTVAASGGYWVAAAAEKIVANPGTTTGSIGVILPLANLQGLMDKLGVDLVAITSGKFKDAGSPNRVLTQEEREVFQGLVENVHDQFIRAIADGRGLERAQVEAVADGRLLTGEQALGLGLVDQLGNFRDAVELAQQLTGLDDSAEVVWVGPKAESLLGRIIKESLTETFNHFLAGLGDGSGAKRPINLAPH